MDLELVVMGIMPLLVLVQTPPLLIEVLEAVVEVVAMVSVATDHQVS